MGPQSEISTPKALEKIWDRKGKSFHDKKKKEKGVIQKEKRWELWREERIGINIVSQLLSQKMKGKI